jgi:hypothetical protein
LTCPHDLMTVPYDDRSLKKRDILRRLFERE